MRLPKDGQILLGCTYVRSSISGELARTGSVTSLSSHPRPRELSFTLQYLPLSCIKGW